MPQLHLNFDEFLALAVSSRSIEPAEGGGEEEEPTEEEEEKMEELQLFKSRDPHLAGGEKHLIFF